jgi:hypothetical protein
MQLDETIADFDKAQQSNDGDFFAIANRAFTRIRK